jgi:putative ABC transport system permease protein
MLSAVLQDATFACRQFRRSPGFAATVVFTLAMGIGATTAIFSLIEGVLLRPLPFPNADRLVEISTLEFPPGVAPSNPAAADNIGSSYPDFFDWQRQNHTFETLGSYDTIFRLFSRMDGQDARVSEGGRVSANLLSILGVAPTLGRMFTAEEEQPGHRVIILSHELWVSDFASSPNVIGQIVKVSDEPSIIVGVMPEGFHYPVAEPASFWVTYAADNEGARPGTSLRDWDRLSIVGRLKPRISIQQAQADLNTIQRGLAQQYSEDRHRQGVSIAPLLEPAVSDSRPKLVLLFAAVGVVLLIGCANVAGLLLARASGRRAELALRTALGATRFRVVRQLLLEGFLLALAAGAVGVAICYVALRAGIRFFPTQLPRLYDVTLDDRVLAFSIFLSAATALIFGLVPAWRMSGRDPSHALKEAGVHMTSGRRRNHLHHGLVAAETALTFALLIGSGLLIRSVVNLFHIDPGLDTKNTVSFDVALTNKRYPVPGKVEFNKRLLPQLAAIPGVERVGSCHPLPVLWGRDLWTDLTIAGQLSSPENPPGAIAAVATPGYFETLSIPLLQGRTFEARDNDAKSPSVAIINQSFAKRYFPDENPVGHYFTPEFDPVDEPTRARQIVGVVGDTMTSDSWNPYQPEFFLPYAQNPSHQRAGVVMKVSGNPKSYEETVRKIVAGLDKDAPMFDYSTFPEKIAMENSQPRFEAGLVSGFAAIALLLSAIGLYSVLSYIVAERMRELGLRIALGASRSDILRMVLRRALILSCIGIVIGTLVSLFGTRLFAHALFKVTPLDRSVFLAVTVVLILISIVSALAPAVRAANVNPMRTLREL